MTGSSLSNTAYYIFKRPKDPTRSVDVDDTLIVPVVTKGYLMQHTNRFVRLVAGIQTYRQTARFWIWFFI
jgi:hypothetical protein